MSGDGRQGRGLMADQRSRGNVGSILESWMAAAAPARAPERLLEESFARTMAAGQLRVYPWHRVGLGRRRWSRGSRLGGLALGGLALVVTIAVATGLVVGPGPGPGVGGPSPSSSPSPGPSSAPSSSPLPFPSAVAVEPTAEIAVNAPMALTSDGTSIWAFTGNSDLLRIDPKANAVAASVKLSLTTDAFQGFAGDRDGLWITDWNANQLLRFDPQTLRSITSIGTVALSKGVLIAGGSVWVASTRGGSVQRVDPKTNKIVTTISVGPTGPSGPNWLAEGLGSIWVGIPNAAAVVRINEATNAIQATIPIVGPASPCGGLAAGSTATWITSCDGGNLVTQIDPITNIVAGTIDLGGNGYTFAMVADRPWISPNKGQIVRLDPVRRVVDRVVAPGPGFSGGGDVVVAAGSLWVIDEASNRILRLPIAAFGG